MHEIGTTTDEDAGNSTTIYGSEGMMSEDEAIESGLVTQEEPDACTGAPAAVSWGISL